ncbi:MAG: metal-dependent transcriptional regulator [Melioribacteraceae bacterium]|nr:metal-dependent transcriptional regulator [Melioribacteraceae bacterium]MCF8264713.1 metal-dependent transcriptional regulator [Melioribacteraceae bacterium]MCF8431371.1 metal-dependent transcriptional regulator [Melioribacteraceae bacterium]
MSSAIKIEKTPETWKKFEETELTHSSFHHLWAIHELLKQNGYARSSDVSKNLNISRGSASITLRKLKEKGYIEEDQNKFYHLTEVAQKLINATLVNRRAFKKFFNEILGIDPEVALEDACKIEHLISLETAENLIKFLEFFTSNESGMKKYFEGFKEYQKKCTTECDVCETECIFDHDIEKSE